VGYLVSIFSLRHIHYKAERMMHEAISPEEIATLTKLGLEENEYEMKRMEFIVLMMVRMELVDMDIISLVANRFDELDESKSGTVNVAKLLFGQKV
jgi:hypothetical protein